MTRRYWLDLVERTARTFLQGFLGVVTLDAFTTIDVTWSQKIYVGLLAGGYAVLSAFAARGVGNPDSASVIDGE